MFLLFQLTKIFTLHDKPIGSAPMGPEVTVFLCLLVPGLWFSSRCCCWWPDRSGSLPVSLPPTCLLDHLSTPPHPTKHTGLFALFFLSLLFQTIVLVLVFFFFVCFSFRVWQTDRQDCCCHCLFFLVSFLFVQRGRAEKEKSQRTFKPNQNKVKEPHSPLVPVVCSFINQPTTQHSTAT